jgi:hypothetical protein
MIMTSTVVRYTVKPGAEHRNVELVRAVYRQLEEVRLEGFRYATYRLGDGRTFVHVAEQDADGASPLPGLTAFRAFQAGIHDRCESGPVVSGAEVIGRFKS